MPDIALNSTGVLQLEKSKRFSIVDTALTKLTDAQLLQRYSTGDENAFRELVTRYKNSIYTFLMRFLNRHDLVEDIFQETFIQLFASMDSFDMSRPLRPWLFRIAANKAKDAIRKLKKAQEIPIGAIANSQNLSFNDVLDAITSDDLTPTDKLETSENAVLVKEVISLMPVDLKEILLLAYFNGFSYKQIAEILDIPVGTVKSRLHKAVWDFAKLWESLYENMFIK